VNDLQADELVRRSGRGDAAAFAALIGRYEKAALSAAYAVLADASSAGDVVQDAFLAAWKNLAGLDDPAMFGPWLLRIVRNRAIDLRRKRKRQGGVGLEFDVADPHGDAPAELAEEETARRLDAAIAKLDRLTRSAVVMRYYEQLSSREIAEKLRCSPAAVDMRLNRARARLRELLAETDEAVNRS
jgi:RNA polymerase sigma-70 factor, ECF subfamily